MKPLPIFLLGGDILADSIEQAISQLEIQAINLKNKTFIGEIQKKAKKFLLKVDRQIRLYQGLSSRKKIADRVYSVINDTRESTKLTQEIAVAMNTFSTDINRLLGQIEYLSYVEKDGNILFYDSKAVGKVYKDRIYKDSSSGGVGRIDRTQKFLDFASGIKEKQLQQAINRSIERRKLVYQTAMKRYDQSFLGKTETGAALAQPEKYKGYSYAYSQSLKKRFITFQNRGRLAEVYTLAVINEDPDILNGQRKTFPFESGIEKLLNNAHQSMDNKAAAIEQDVVKGRVEFAVKSGKFQTAGFIQYINLAERLLLIDPASALTVEDYKKVAAGLVKYSNEEKIQKIIQAASKHSEKQLKQALRKLNLEIQ